MGVYKLIVNEKEFKINIKDESINENKINLINRAIKTSLKRVHNMDFMDLLINELKFDIEKCRICKKEYPPVFMLFNIKDEKINIIGFTYTKEIYCYNKNTECEGKGMNSNSIKYISKIYNLSPEDALKKLKQKNKSPFYKESWDNEEDYKNYQRRDVGFFEEHGKITYNEFIEKLSYSFSLDSYIDKYGIEEGVRIFKKNSMKKDSMSLEYFINKYNDDEIGKYYYELRKKSVNVSLDNLILKYGAEKGNIINDIRKVKLQYINTIEYYIETYGFENGTLKYYDRLKNISYKNTFEYYKEKYGVNAEFEWLKRTVKSKTKLEDYIEVYNDLEIATNIRNVTLNNKIVCGSVSKESVDFFDKIKNSIVNILNIDESDIKYNYGNELKLFDNDTYFLYDFTIKNHKIIIEYNGIKFHPNKSELTLDEWKIWKPARGYMNADELYERQEYKKNLAIKNGYKIIEIWNDKPFHVNYDLCMEFIKNNIKK